jgi:hypothetical protein
MPHVLEDFRPLSQSLLWGKIGEFYEAHGRSAFTEHTVPNYVTTNAFVARAYSRVIFGFLKDAIAAGQIDPEHPIYVIEIGAGSGRLGYRTFLELRNLATAAGLSLNIKLILTDLGEANREFWLNHFRLVPLIEQGLIDVARFNVSTDRELHLEASGVHLAPGSFKNPAILLANYVFDTLPCDLYWVDAEGQLSESLVELCSSVEVQDWAEPKVWGSLTMNVHRRPIQSTSYADPAWNAIMQQCVAQVRDGVVVFPAGALRSLGNLSELFNNRFLLLSSDKGYHHPEFSPTKEVHFSIDGCFSIDVNFRAFELWFQSLGGQSFFPSYNNKRLETCAFARLDSVPLVNTALAFEDAIAAFSPYDYLRVAMWAEPGQRPISILEYLAFLRLSNYDSLIASRHADQLLEKIPNAKAEERHQLLLAIDRVWAGYFPLGEQEDAPLALGKMMIALAYWEPAVELLIASVGIYGETGENTYHLALCCLQLDDLERAAYLAGQAVKLAPNEPKNQDLVKAIAERQAK